MRSGSGTSRTTATSDSGELDINGRPVGQTSQSSLSGASSSPSQFSGTSSFFHVPHPTSHPTHTASNSNSSASTFNVPSPGQPGSTLNPPSSNPASALSPIATRMRERDADAMEKYLRRNRSGSQGTSSTDTKSQNGSTFSSAGPSANGDDITSLTRLPISGSVTPRRLRPSMSAAQLRSGAGSPVLPTDSEHSSRDRSGTTPNITRPKLSPLPILTRSSSTSKSSKPLITEEPESFTGPPSQYAQFPEPPPPEPDINSTPTTSRRLPFNLLRPSLDLPSSSHRRGQSVTSVRGA